MKPKRYILVTYETPMGDFDAAFHYIAGDSDDGRADMELQQVTFNNVRVTDVLNEHALSILRDLAYDEVY